jgi:hypothetical protein
MDQPWQEAIWGQFGAAIDMLANAVESCPEDLWYDRARDQQFWYLVSHTLFWLDLYLSEDRDGFRPPPPFGLEELDPAGVIPEPPYTKSQLQDYLAHGRRKCRETIAGMSPERAAQRHAFRWGEVSGMELLIYNLRHVQHGAAQLNLILRQETDAAPRWVGRARDDHGDK